MVNALLKAEAEAYRRLAKQLCLDLEQGQLSTGKVQAYLNQEAARVARVRERLAEIPTPALKVAKEPKRSTSKKASAKRTVKAS